MGEGTKTGEEFDLVAFRAVANEKEKAGKIHVVTPAKHGNIPVLMASGVGLAEAWENSMIALYAHGGEIRTQYDKKDSNGSFIDPPSRDSSLTIVVEDPSSEPLIHMAFPGGLDVLEEYRQEVIYGIKDHWVRDPTDLRDNRWEYTYHGRLFDYNVPLDGVNKFLSEMPKEKRDEINQERKKNGLKPLEFLIDKNFARVEEREVKKWFKDATGEFISGASGKQEVLVVDQMEYALQKLAAQPYTRQAQAITWQPSNDLTCFDPPCLQSIWMRMMEDEEGVYRLNMNVRFRSRDAYDAAFMNCFGFIELQKELVSTLSERMGKEVKVGRYVDSSDSYHIYGSRLNHFEEGFLKLLRERSFEERTWTREFVQPFFDEAKSVIVAKVAAQDENVRQQLAK